MDQLPLLVVTRIESGGRDEDRLVVEQTDDRVLIVVADGAGGTGNGALAAQRVCEAAVEMFRAGTPNTWHARLASIDARIAGEHHGGLSTGVVIEIHAGRLSGASVGDSGAWLVSADGVLDLTEHQHRKPLLGSGEARPVAIAPVSLRGRLLVATDGLFKYAARSVLATATVGGTPDDAARLLVEAVRMNSGRLQDDVAVVVCETT